MYGPKIINAFERATSSNYSLGAIRRDFGVSYLKKPSSYFLTSHNKYIDKIPFLKNIASNILDRIPAWTDEFTYKPYIGNLKSSLWNAVRAGEGTNYIKTVAFHEGLESYYLGKGFKYDKRYSTHINPRVLFGEARFIGSLGDKKLFEKFFNFRSREATNDPRFNKIIRIYEKEYGRGLARFSAKNLTGRLQITKAMQNNISTKLMTNKTAGLVNQVLYKNRINHNIASIIKKTKHLFKILR